LGKNAVRKRIKKTMDINNATDFELAKLVVQPIQASLFGGNNLSSSGL
jgi:hypothetical protein